MSEYLEGLEEAIETAKILGQKKPIFNMFAVMLQKDLDEVKQIKEENERKN